MKQLTGKISVGKYSGPKTDRPVFIHVTDAVSGCRFLEINLTLEDFASACFGRGETPCTLEVNLDAPIGMKAENKEEIVPFNCWSSDRKREDSISRALAPFEVDGWKGRREDLTNGHCRVSEGKQRVVFFRHVNPENGEPVL